MFKKRDKLVCFKSNMGAVLSECSPARVLSLYNIVHQFTYIPKHTSFVRYMCLYLGTYDHTN